jgi:GcrA cell cycle regulator
MAGDDGKLLITGKEGKRMNRNTEWTDAMVEKLTTLWEHGMTAKLIARELRVTKNMVVGKARRLGCTPRPSPIVRTGARPSVVRLPKLSVVQVLEPPVIYRPNLARRTEPCSFPLGDVGRPGFRYCDQPTKPGKSYCPDHYAVAYIRREPKPLRLCEV